MSINSYKQTITNYSLDNCKRGNQGYQRVLLQLFGLPGNGKSSFINSCKFVIDGVYKEDAMVGGEKESHGGKTTRRVPYDLTNVIMMVDNRGCPKLNKFETGEIFAQLANLLPLDEEVVWVREKDKEGKDKGRDYDTNVDRLMDEAETASDFIVPIFVHSVMNTIHSKEISSYKEILKTARELTGINPLVLLTHKSHGGLTAQETVFKDMGSDKIYAIENYTKVDHQKVLGKHEEILKLLCQVLKEVDFCMEAERDPKSERNDRMKFVLKYMSEAEDDAETERERERERERKEAAKRESEKNERRERERRERETIERERREREEKERQNKCTIM